MNKLTFTDVHQRLLSYIGDFERCDIVFYCNCYPFEIDLCLKGSKNYLNIVLNVGGQYLDEIYALEKSKLNSNCISITYNNKREIMRTINFFYNFMWKNNNEKNKYLTKT